MKAYPEVASFNIGDRRGAVTLKDPVPFRKGDVVTLRKYKTKNSPRMNVSVDKIDGNTFEFNVPKEDHNFQRPDFGDSLLVAYVN